jgi:hypothetical protein
VTRVKRVVVAAISGLFLTMAVLPLTSVIGGLSTQHVVADPVAGNGGVAH